SRSSIDVFSLTDPDLPNVRKAPLPADATIVRIVEHHGAPYVLDSEGHWYLVSEANTERAPSFDPNDDDGRIARFKELRFELHSDGAMIHGVPDGPLAWPLAARQMALFAIDDDRLVVF